MVLVAQFSLPNTQTGGSQTINASSLSDAQSQAQSAGTWSPAAGTYGANSTLGGGGGGGGGTGAATPASTDMSGLAAFAAQTSGVTQAQLAQQKAEFDAQLQFARDQMTQLGIPQLQINQQLAQLQQQQFQAQLTLAAQAQQVSQAQTNAQLTGWLQPTPSVPSVSQWTGQGGTTAGGGTTGGGGTSWNQLSQQLQQQAGGNYNDAAGKSAFIQATGGNPASFNGGAAANLSQAQINQIMSAGSNGLLGGGTQAGGTGTAGGGITWNQLSGLLQQQAGGNYNDAAGKNAFMQATGASPANFNGGANVSLDPTTLSNIVSAGSNGQIASYGALAGAPAAGGAPITGGTAAPNQNQPQQTLAGQLQQATLSGQYQGMPTEQAREFNQNLALQQGQLGQQYLSTAAQLQGPQNTFQLSNYMRGAQGNQAVPTYLANLAGNVGNAAFQGAGTTAPIPQTAGNLAGQLMGQQGASQGWDYGQTTGTLRNLMGSAQTLKPGSIEQLTPDELQALGSGLGAVGGSLPSFLAQYNASRVGQQAPVARTSLA